MRLESPTPDIGTLALVINKVALPLISNAQQINDEIKLIHQDYQLYPNATVVENIARPLLNYDPEYRKQRVRRLLEQLGLENYSERFPRQLSGGQQQKVIRHGQTAQSSSLPEPKRLNLGPGTGFS